MDSAQAFLMIAGSHTNTSRPVRAGLWGVSFNQGPRRGLSVNSWKGGREPSQKDGDMIRVKRIADFVSNGCQQLIGLIGQTPDGAAQVRQNLLSIVGFAEKAPIDHRHHP